MKRAFRYLFNVLLLVLVLNPVVMVKSESTNDYDIFSNEYPDDYEVMTSSAWFNRAIHELNQNFELGITENQIRFYSKDEIIIEGVNEKIKTIRLSFSEDKEFNIIIEIIPKDEKYADYLLEFTPNILSTESQEFDLSIEREEAINHQSQVLDEWKEFMNDAGRGYTEDEITEKTAGEYDTGLLNNKTSHYIQGIVDVTTTIDGTKDVQFIYPQYIISRDIADELNNDTIEDFSVTELSENESKIHFQLTEEVIENPSFEHNENLASMPEPGPEDYELIPYEDIMRDRNGKIGTLHTFYATVLQYEENLDEGFAFALLLRDDDPDKIYSAMFFDIPESRLIEGEHVDVYGLLMGLDSYETVLGVQNTVPLIFIDDILIEGIDY